MRRSVSQFAEYACERKPHIPIRYERTAMTHRYDTHSVLIGYLLWILGFTGAHRFYYGKPITGTIWFFTLGLLLIGWIIDLFLIPGMDRRAGDQAVCLQIGLGRKPIAAGDRIAVSLVQHRERQ